MSGLRMVRPDSNNWSMTFLPILVCGVVSVQSVQEDMHDWNTDWDILYLFSAVSSVIFLFLENSKLACPMHLMQFMSHTVPHRLEEVRTPSLTLICSVAAFKFRR